MKQNEADISETKSGDASASPLLFWPRRFLENDVRTHLELAGEGPAINIAGCAESAGGRAYVGRVVLRPIEKVEGVEAQLNLDIFEGRKVLLHVAIPVARVILAKQVSGEGPEVFSVELDVGVVRVRGRRVRRIVVNRVARVGDVSYIEG